MSKIKMSVLRGICQTPAYVAYETGIFKKYGLDVELEVIATAWLIPKALENGSTQFALLPWTRVAASDEEESKLVVVAGSGHEEAAIVLRKGKNIEDVKKVVVPLRGGMKDLTAMGLIRSLGWTDVELLRQPSGDGAIIAFFGGGADAASMVEPYATMLEQQGIGTVVKRTGDLWPGAPGCSLSTTTAMRDSDPESVQKFVNAFLEAVDFVHNHRKETAQIAQKYIGINANYIEKALASNSPQVNAIRNQESMDKIINLMLELGYLKKRPTGYCDLSFLDEAQAYSRAVN
jgi:NitT/TauT family transport system substrate-binding protein